MTDRPDTSTATSSTGGQAMSAPQRIWAYTGDGYGDRMTDHGSWDTGLDGQPDCHPEWPHAPYTRSDLCDPLQDERVRGLVEVQIAEDTAANKRATSRDRKQYLRGRIEAMKDFRAALAALEQGGG